MCLNSIESCTELLLKKYAQTNIGLQDRIRITTIISHYHIN